MQNVESEPVTPIDLGIGSHIPILAAIVARTSGAVLECGMGIWSTYMLHFICLGRPLLSLDSDESWLTKLEHLRSVDHELRLVTDWKAEDDIDKASFDVAFVDHSPGEERIHTAMRLKAHCRFVVCHDTEADIPPAAGNYQWIKLEGVWKNTYTYKAIRPWTTIYSDEEIPL